MTVQTAEYDGAGRRMKKVVASSGELDGTVVYLYDGWKICETRDGSGNVYQQFIHGTRYIDELVMMRVADKGDVYVHQDANWNVIGLTDQGGSTVERYVLSPYGQLTVHQETGYGDYDGDGDVDATDRAAGEVGGACRGAGPSGPCRILDLDFDNDVDDTDLAAIDALPSGLAQHPGRFATAVDQPFAHQGLLFDAEIGSYQNRHRQSSPRNSRFAQRDPLTSNARPHSEARNFYEYLSNNTLARLDPSGLRACWPVRGIFICEQLNLSGFFDFGPNNPRPSHGVTGCCSGKAGTELEIGCEPFTCVDPDLDATSGFGRCVSLHELEHWKHQECFETCEDGCIRSEAHWTELCDAVKAEYSCLRDCATQQCQDELAFVECQINVFCDLQQSDEEGGVFICQPHLRN